MIKRFNRFELKYMVTARQADALAAEIQAYMTPDPEGGPSGQYGVTSLYYDSLDLSFYRSKVEGIKFRRKLRVRRYGPLGDPPVQPVTVEIKQRISRTTQKRRIVLPLTEALAFCDGEAEPVWSDPQDVAVAGEIEYLVRSMVLRPVCAVGYLRQALVGTVYDPGLRVTFDRGLWVRDPAHGLLEPGPRLPLLRADCAVLEVKANDVVPLWTARMLASHGITVDRYSKYCAGMRRVRSLPPLPLPDAEDD